MFAFKAVYLSDLFDFQRCIYWILAIVIRFNLNCNKQLSIYPSIHPIIDVLLSCVNYSSVN